MVTVRQRRKKKYGGLAPRSMKSKRKLARRLTCVVDMKNNPAALLDAGETMEEESKSSGRGSSMRWDLHTTSEKNYARMGIARNVNLKPSELARVREKRKEAIETDRAISPPPVGEEAIRPPPPARNLCDRDLLLIEELLAKHATNLTRMVRDRLRNPYQWTRKQIVRRICMYVEQIRAGGIPKKRWDEDDQTALESRRSVRESALARADEILQDGNVSDSD